MVENKKYLLYFCYFFVFCTTYIAANSFFDLFISRSLMDIYYYSWIIFSIFFAGYIIIFTSISSKLYEYYENKTINDFEEKLNNLNKFSNYSFILVVFFIFSIFSKSSLFHLTLWACNLTVWAVIIEIKIEFGKIFKEFYDELKNQNLNKI